jgi:hypothetical protein
VYSSVLEAQPRLMSSNDKRVAKAKSKEEKPSSSKLVLGLGEVEEDSQYWLNEDNPITVIDLVAQYGPRILKGFFLNTSNGEETSRWIFCILNRGLGRKRAS